jgi:hypothetical protein
LIYFDVNEIKLTKLTPTRIDHASTLMVDIQPPELQNFLNKQTNYNDNNKKPKHETRKPKK